MKLTKFKPRPFSNKKTRRIKRRGGMHKSKRLYQELSPRSRAAAYEKERVTDPHRNKELTAAHTVLAEMLSRGRGVSPDVRTDLLKSGTGALAGSVSSLLLAKDSHLLRKHGDAALHRPHTSVPALLAADDMFQQAQQLCSRVKGLSDAEMWTRSKWGAMTCSATAKTMCAEAVALYKGAIAHKYLPAYAPLAWMMSYSLPHESLRLCDECIVVCDSRISAPFARKAKTDCTALRAFVQCEQFISDQEFAEGLAPGGHMDYEISAKPPMEELKKIESHSIRGDGSKYGHALRWMRLTHQDYLDDWTPELMMKVKTAKEAAETEKAAEAAKTIAEEMGLDFERCRFCIDRH